MKQYKVEVPKELTDSVQGAQLELQGIKDLLGFAYSTTEYNIPEERIKKNKLRKNSEKLLMNPSGQQKIIENRQ